MSINPLYHQTHENLQEESKWIQSAKLNREEFGPLYKKYHESIFRYVYQRLDDFDLAGDIVSQVFIKAMKGIDKYEFVGVPFSSWLYRIAKSEIYQHFRENKKSLRIVNIDQVEAYSLIEEFTSESSNEQVTNLCKAIELLKDHDIQLIEMRFFEQRNFKEIGEILEITENNAKVKTFRALERLKSHFHTI
jgi:RNA polymerase sigma-70 factor (ECF subfamily)